MLQIDWFAIWLHPLEFCGCEVGILLRLCTQTHSHNFSAEHAFIHLKHRILPYAQAARLHRRSLEIWAMQLINNIPSILFNHIFFQPIYARSKRDTKSNSLQKRASVIICPCGTHEKLQGLLCRPVRTRIYLFVILFICVFNSRYRLFYLTAHRDPCALNKQYIFDGKIMLKLDYKQIFDFVRAEVGGIATLCVPDSSSFMYSSTVIKRGLFLVLSYNCSILSHLMINSREIRFGILLETIIEAVALSATNSKPIIYAL